METENRGNSLGLRCKKLKPLKKMKKPRAKKVLARSITKSKTKEVLAKGFKKPKLFKTKNKP